MASTDFDRPKVPVSAIVFVVVALAVPVILCTVGTIGGVEPTDGVSPPAAQSTLEETGPFGSSAADADVIGSGLGVRGAGTDGAVATGSAEANATSADAGGAAAPSSADNSSEVFSGCPLPLPEQTNGVSYQQLAHTQVWKAFTPLSCREYARLLLLALRGSPLQLADAGYLDMAGNAWGCVLSDAAGGSYIATLQTLREADDQALTTVSVVRILIPEGA
ncbi:MAG: hypothetical protein LBP28_05955 [Coriobacteriales bacterium]|jgi:hypothetical protein|nr:hypothetical protein [Coriobacteriales bacterium]